MASSFMPRMFGEIQKAELNEPCNNEKKENLDLPLFLAAINGQLPSNTAYINEFPFNVPAVNSANFFQDCQYFFPFVDNAQILIKVSRDSRLPVPPELFLKQFQRIKVISPDQIVESENEEESREIKQLREKRLLLIRARRALKRKFWLPFSTKLQAELRKIEAEMEVLSAEIFEKTKTQIDLSGMIADLKQGQENLSLCLQRLENSHAQENLR